MATVTKKKTRKKAAAKKTPASKAPAKKATAKKTPASKATAKKATANNAVAANVSSKKATTKKPASVRATATTAPEPERSSPAMAEVDTEVLEFIAAIDDFKQRNGRPFPSWSEVLLVVRQLGYSRS